MRISIHALCEEGDMTARATIDRLMDFYPRPLRGGRLAEMVPQVPGQIFLSTPSARRATPEYDEDMKLDELFLSTPSARRATADR